MHSVFLWPQRTAAASRLLPAKLDIPLPTVIRQVVELERELGASLFARTSRGRVGPGIELLNEFENDATLGRAELTGRLRL